MNCRLQQIIVCVFSLLSLVSCSHDKQESFDNVIAVNGESFCRVHKEIAHFPLPGMDYDFLKQTADSIKAASSRLYIWTMPLEESLRITDDPKLHIFLETIFSEWIDNRCSLVKLPIEYWHYYTYEWTDWEKDIFESIDKLIDQYADSITNLLNEEFPSFRIDVKAEQIIPDELIQKIIDREISDLVDEKLSDLLSIGSSALTMKYQISIEKEIASQMATIYENYIYMEAISQTLL